MGWSSGGRRSKARCGRARLVVVEVLTQDHAARMTVSHAINTLKDEGFLFSVSGSGVYVSNTVKPELVQHQTERMPSDVRPVIRGTAQEYESQETRESVIARDADKLEAIVQRRQYEREGGYSTTECQASAIASLKTGSAKLSLTQAQASSTAAPNASSLMRAKS